MLNIKNESLTTNTLMRCVLNGGDDYELLFTVKKNKAKFFENLCKKKNFPGKVSHVDVFVALPNEKKKSLWEVGHF